MNKPILTRSITFDKAAQDALPQWVKDKMKADRAAAQKKQKCKHEKAYFVGSVGDEYCPDCDSFAGLCI